MSRKSRALGLITLFVSGLLAAVVFLKPAPAGTAAAMTVTVNPIVSVLVSKTGGIVRGVEVNAGDKVRKGQVLVYLDAPDLVARRKELDSSIHALQTAMENHRSLLRLPAQIQNAMKDSHPEVVRAEQEYVR